MPQAMAKLRVMMIRVIRGIIIRGNNPGREPRGNNKFKNKSYETTADDDDEEDNQKAGKTDRTCESEDEGGNESTGEDFATRPRPPSCWPLRLLVCLGMMVQVFIPFFFFLLLFSSVAAFYTGPGPRLSTYARLASNHCKFLCGW